MNTTKDDIVSMIKNLPDNATIEDIQYHLYVLDKISKGRQSIQDGQVIPHDQVAASLKRWLDR